MFPRLFKYLDFEFPRIIHTGNITMNQCLFLINYNADIQIHSNDIQNHATSPIFIYIKRRSRETKEILLGVTLRKLNIVQRR